MNLKKTIRNLIAYSTRQRELQRRQLESAPDGTAYRSSVVDAYSQIIKTLGSLGGADDATTKEAQEAETKPVE